VVVMVVGTGGVGGGPVFLPVGNLHTGGEGGCGRTLHDMGVEVVVVPRWSLITGECHDSKNKLEIRGETRLRVLWCALRLAQAAPPTGFASRWEWNAMIRCCGNKPGGCGNEGAKGPCGWQEPSIGGARPGG